MRRHGHPRKVYRRQWASLDRQDAHAMNPWTGDAPPEVPVPESAACMLGSPYMDTRHSCARLRVGLYIHHPATASATPEPAQRPLKPLAASPARRRALGKANATDELLVLWVGSPTGAPGVGARGQGTLAVHTHHTERLLAASAIAIHVCGPSRKAARPPVASSSEEQDQDPHSGAGDYI